MGFVRTNQLGQDDLLSALNPLSLPNVLSPGLDMTSAAGAAATAAPIVTSSAWNLGTLLQGIFAPAVSAGTTALVTNLVGSSGGTSGSTAQKATAPASVLVQPTVQAPAAASSGLSTETVGLIALGGIGLLLVAFMAFGGSRR